MSSVGMLNRVACSEIVKSAMQWHQVLATLPCSDASLRVTIVSFLFLIWSFIGAQFQIVSRAKESQVRRRWY